MKKNINAKAWIIRHCKPSFLHGGSSIFADSLSGLQPNGASGKRPQRRRRPVARPLESAVRLLQCVRNCLTVVCIGIQG